MTGAIRSSSSATELLHLGHLERRQGGVGHDEATLSTVGVPAAAASPPDPLGRGYSRGHASPGVAAACPRGGRGDTRHGRLAAADRPVAADPTARSTATPRPNACVASRAQARTAPARARAVERDPLAVTIDALTPSYHPRTRVRSRSRGSVTNRSRGPLDRDQPARLHRRHADHDQRRAGRGRRARPGRVRRRPDHRPPAPSTRVDELAPGQSSPFTIRVPQSRSRRHRARASTGSACTRSASPTSPRDDIADGRARTFLPLVPRHQAAGRRPRW